MIAIFASSLCLMAILYAFSEDPFKYNQDFTRTYSQGIIQQEGAMDLGDDVYYIAGATNTRIFFGNAKDSLDLLIADMFLSTPRHVRLSIEGEKDQMLKDAFIEIDSPFFYIKSGDLPAIYKGNLDNWKALRVLKHTPYFSRATSLGEDAFALQVTGGEAGTTAQRNMLCTVNTDTLHTPSMFVLEGSVDHYFSSLGILRHCKGLDRLVYTYFYSNQYLVLDRNLKLLYRGNTIDTVSRAQINPMEVRNGTYSLASPKSIVNINAQVYGDMLFVHSNLMAANDNREFFDRSSVIDVYDIASARYQFSFYLPDYNGSHVFSFKIFSNGIVALYDHHAIAYSLSKQFLQSVKT